MNAAVEQWDRFCARLADALYDALCTWELAFHRWFTGDANANTVEAQNAAPQSTVPAAAAVGSTAPVSVGSSLGAVASWPDPEPIRHAHPHAPVLPPEQRLPDGVVYSVRVPGVFEQRNTLYVHRVDLATTNYWAAN